MNIWVIGCPRSGTTFLTDFLGKFCDYSFNEPWKGHPWGKIEDWTMPHGTGVLKYCENYQYADRIAEKFPNSKFIHAIRNPFDNVFSIYKPKIDSLPYREFKNFPNLGEFETEERAIASIELWYKYILGCLQVGLAYPQLYTEIVYEDFSSHAEVQIQKLREFLHINLEGTPVFHDRNTPHKDCMKQFWSVCPKQLKFANKINEWIYNHRSEPACSLLELPIM